MSAPYAKAFTRLETELLKARELLDTVRREYLATSPEPMDVNLYLTRFENQLVALLDAAEKMQDLADGAHRLLTGDTYVEITPERRIQLAARQLTGEDAPTVESVSYRRRCPTHDRTDCSPLLNGCTLLTGRLR